MEKEKTVEITKEMAPLAPENQLGVYKLHRWTWYAKQSVIQKATTIIDAGKGITQVSMPEFNTHMLLECLSEAPFEITYETVRDELDANVGDILFIELQELNGVTPGEKRDFTEPPGSVKIILG